MKLGVVITASFCTLKKTLDILKDFKNAGYDIFPILSNKIIEYDTRFGKAEDFINEIETIAERKAVKDIVEAEKFDDLASQKLARDIAKKIEDELDYPGQIKVTVVREFRATEIAK